MNIGIIHIAAAAIGALVIFGFIIYVLFLRSRPAYPVKCIHCQQYHDRETIVTYSDQPGQWAICPECVKEYWDMR